MMDPREGTALRIQWCGQTDRGRVRKNNEDSFLALQFDAREVNYLGKVGEASMGHYDFAFAVSDGMGGANAGEFASRIAVEKITRLLPRSYKLNALGLRDSFGDVMEVLFDQIHRGLTFLGNSYDECSGMGATLSLAWFVPGWMYFGHIGDSRIYYLPGSGGPLRQITEDHTFVGWLHRTGQINERQARMHPAKNALQQALGAGHQFVNPQVGAVGCEPGDVFLLCSDGIVDGLFDASLEEMLRHSAQVEQGLGAAAVLVRESVDRSGRDNTTAVVIRILPP